MYSPYLAIYCHSRSHPFIYTGRGRVEKFKFVFMRRLDVAATLFCPEFICSYITCNLTILILRGKQQHDLNYPLTHVLLYICGYSLSFREEFNLVYSIYQAFFISKLLINRQVETTDH